MDFFRQTSTKFFLGCILVLIGIAACLGYFASSFQRELSASKASLDATNKQILALKNDVGSCTTQLADLTKTSAQQDPLRKSLEDQVEAFALQAKGCESIKKSLHIKD